MTPSQLEALTLDVTQRVKQCQPLEDSRVELKGEWPELPTGARRLAAHANAARGEPIVWIVGLDEKRGVLGAERASLPSWLDRLASYFDGYPPELLRDLNVSTPDGTLVALLFDTGRAPFVVKNPVHGQPGGGPVALEVPIRYGSAVRSATHSDLVRILVPLQRVPSVEPLTAELLLRRSAGSSASNAHLIADLYFTPFSRELCVIPLHRSSVTLAAGGTVHSLSLQELSPPTVKIHSLGRTKTEEVLSHTVSSSPSELLISGPGLAKARARALLDFSSLGSHATLQARFSLYVIHADRQVECSFTLGARREDGDGTRWELVQPGLSNREHR